MKPKVEKLSSGAIKVEYAQAPSQKPLSVVLDRQQCELLIATVRAAGNADVFKVELEL